MILQLGSKCSEVNSIQEMLNAVLHTDLIVDGIFGRNTQRVVRTFQQLHNLLVDGIVGNQTYSVLLREFKKKMIILNTTNVPDSDRVLKRFIDLRDFLLSKPVIYGPGRGLFKNITWIVTYGPGDLNLKSWKCSKPLGPSFHCSSLVNFILSYLINRNHNYTHTGNIPPLFGLVKTSGIGVYNNCKYRGFSPYLIRFAGCGDTLTRNPFLRVEKAGTHLDSQEILDRVEELPTFSVWSQSDKNKVGKWYWEHHVGFLVKIDDVLYRFASDGYTSEGVYSGTPISWKKFENNKCLYQVFRLDLSIPLESNVEFPVIFEE